MSISVKQPFSSIVYLAALVLCCSIGFSSCKTFKDSATGVRMPKRSIEELNQVVDSLQFEYYNFSTRIKMNYRDAQGTESGFAHVRLKKDSLIWISLRKVSIEGARILISPDSVFILDRTNKQYFPMTFEQLLLSYGLDLKFSQLQDLIIGNSFERDGIPQLGWKEDRYYWLVVLENVENEFWIDPHSMYISQMRMTEKASQRSVNMVLDKYEIIDNQPFATDRKLSFSDSQVSELELIYSKTEYNTDNLSFDFHVNPRYEVILSGE